ncbi:hypothetical protein PHMEG_00015578 [Phytophthora megakarya]|uniref:Uncharacterized protein n=1 Tax=Phytophthora megakarya TaxID=4795 RepID=A0A225W130_9STRA|nr:hypothetical protein PHMEG_00015578 [Phytophthora megakarya]
MACEGDVRGACTALNTKRTYKSYINGISKWILENLTSPESFFDTDGELNVAVFTASYFAINK